MAAITHPTQPTKLLRTRASHLPFFPQGNHSPKRLAQPRSPIPPLSTPTAHATHARPLSLLSVVFCAIWGCVSSSSSSSSCKGIVVGKRAHLAQVSSTSTGPCNQLGVTLDLVLCLIWGRWSAKDFRLQMEARYPSSARKTTQTMSLVSGSPTCRWAYTARAKPGKHMKKWGLAR
jgi:hypothetical protein